MGTETKGTALQDDSLENASGGYKIYHSKENVEMYDNAGNYIGSTWYAADANDILRKKNLSDMNVSPEDMQNLRQNGHFDKNGNRYFSDGTVKPLSEI